MSYLYRYECKGIQSWILQSKKLRDNVGASSIIEDLSDEARSAAGGHGGEVVLAAAGVGLITFKDAAGLARFASEWPMRVHERAPGLPLVQGWVSDDGPNDAEAAVRQVIEHVAAARNLPVPRLPVAPPIARRAQRTGDAAIERREESEELDAGMASQRARSEGRDAAEDRLWQRLGTGLDSPEADLARWGESYVAVLHADGNNVGHAFIECPRALLSAFSRSLQGVTEAAVREATLAAHREWLSTLRKPPNFPLRPLVVGGDDVTVILPARLAPTFAQTFARVFEESAAEQRAKLIAAKPTLADALGRLTTKVGIVLVKPTFPFAQAHGLAEALCKAAKARGGTATSQVFLHRVTTSLVDGIDGIDAELGGLFGGPYGLGPDGTFDTLLNLSHTLRSVPRGPLREWVDLVGAGDPNRAQTRWLRLRTVLKTRAPKDLDALDASLRACGADPNTGLRTDGTTPVYDALTLLAVEWTRSTVSK